MNSLSLQSVISRNPLLVSSEIDNERIMMNTKTGEYYGLDAIGNRIWTLLEKPIKISSLIEILVAEFNVSANQCESDTLEFLAQLSEKQLIIQTND